MKATIIAVVALAFSTSHAFAVSLSVKLACKDDYYAHCSQHAVGSPGVRKCMRDVGPRLSSRCIGALADAGMIKSKRVAKTYRSDRRVAATKPAVRKKYAKKSTAKTHVARKQTSKQRFARNASKKQVAKKDTLRRRSDRKRVAYIED